MENALRLFSQLSSRFYNGIRIENHRFSIDYCTINPDPATSAG